MAFPFSKQLYMEEKKQRSKGVGGQDISSTHPTILLQTFTFIKHSKPCCN